MFTATEIGLAGERIVNVWLVDNGYSTNLDTRQPGSTDIQASGQKTNLLVQVKSAITPNVPADLSSDEVRNIKSRASRLGFQAWAAKVVLDSQLRLIGKISWTQL